MRDTLKTSEYFEAYVAYQQELLNLYKEKLENNDGTEDLERIQRLNGGMAKIILQRIIARYSRGDEVADIKPQMNDYLKRILELNSPHDSYNATLYPISYCILFSEPVDWRAKFRSSFFKNSIKKIPAVDGLLDFMATEQKNNEGLIWKRFNKLWQAVLSDSPEEQSKYLTDYVTRWYGSHKNEYWYNEHKESSIDNMDFATYNGYWCFEAGAVAKLLHIPDENLKDHPNYPYDMVHWDDEKRKEETK